MKISLIVSLIWVTFFAQPGEAAMRKYTLDLAKSRVEWKGTFLHASVSASGKFKSGSFSMKNKMLQNGLIVADMRSLSSDSGMDAQFKGPLMLNVEQFPTAELRIKSFTELKSITPDGPNARMTGTLLFRGKSHPVTRDFVVVPDRNGFHVTGSFPTEYQKMLKGDVTYEIWAQK